MKYKAGYREIDFMSKAITAGGQSAVEIPGIWDAIESSPRALLFSNVVIDTEEFNPFFVTVFLSGGTYHAVVKETVSTGVLSVYTLEINDDDEVYCRVSTVGE